MKVFYIILCFSTLLASCAQQGSDSELIFFNVEQSAYEHLINAKVMPSSPDLKADRLIINSDYPIEIALYNDGGFYYNLETLGDGRGTWTQKDGYIELYAERSLFDIYIEIKALDEKAQSLAITFTDRFGPKAIKVDKLNINLKD